MYALTVLCEICHGLEHTAQVSYNANVIRVNSIRRKHYLSIMCGD